MRTRPTPANSMDRYCSRSFVSSLTIVAAWALTGCSGGDEGSAASAGPVETLCKAGEQRCYGNALITCQDDRKGWKVVNCGESKSCAKDGAGFACKAVVCARGSLSCDDKKVTKCPDDGLSEPSAVASCTSGQHCTAGTCVSTKCSDGDKLCGWKAALVCSGGAWKTTKCGADERCDPATAACVKMACTPTVISCADGATSQTCSADGAGQVAKACGGGQVCSDGVCHAKVKGVGDVADAGSDAASDVSADSSDGGGFLDVPQKDYEFEPLDVLVIRKATTSPVPAGTPELSFEFASANFLGVEQMLQITGNKDLDKIEIAIAPIEEFTTGSLSTLGGEFPNSSINMNDGSNDQSQVQWRYQAVEYNVTISEFGDIGGRVKGTFSAEMHDALQKGNVFFIEGTFDIKRSQ